MQAKYYRVPINSVKELQIEVWVKTYNLSLEWLIKRLTFRGLHVVQNVQR